ncbi:MAG TPA: hypothetical protein VJI52_05450 [Candidatus Nanoarchaeia archaeon]|nr:hypothetical protein [Candidatus Nanoarchaeia archaeon]
MVAIFNFDVPTAYIGGAVGGVFVLFLIWYLFRNKGGRLGEEKQEEKETKQLENDEKQAEAAQIDEKKACVKMIKIVRQIQDILRTEMGELYDRTLSESSSINVSLTRMRDEKMGLNRAIEIFKVFHAKLNDFIAKLPKDNKLINGLVSQLIYYQKREYIDLIKELKMDEDEKARLKKLWNEVNDEETGTGSAAA